jgi:hypothetical protein
MVALTIASRLLTQASVGNAIEDSESLGSYSRTLRYAAQTSPSDITTGEMQILRKYRVTH